MVNAKLETIQRDGWPWRLIPRGGRILVPADGWYEWKPLSVEAQPAKQPYYIYGEGPLYLPALSAWRPGDELDQAHGFAIVTNDTLGSMVDVHDRRPVALPPAVAAEWIRPKLAPAEALALLCHALPETAFFWHAVRQEVGNSRYERPDAMDPI